MEESPRFVDPKITTEHAQRDSKDNRLKVDIVYIPLETPLLAAARRRGNPTVDGLGMLLHQACIAWKYWFNIDPEVTAGLRATIEATIPKS